MSSVAEMAPSPTSVATPRVGVLRKQLPNALTVLRVVLATAFFVLLTCWHGLPSARRPPGSGIEPTLLATAVLFIVAAITDALDGYLSRLWGVVSTFGRVMDPFADKVLVVGAFIFLAGPAFHVAKQGGGGLQVTGVLPWMVVLIVARELLVTSIRGLVEGRGKNFQANSWGKLKMILQSVSIPTILAGVAIFDMTPGTPARWTTDLLVWFTVAATAMSGVPYIIRGIQACREDGEGA